MLAVALAMYLAYALELDSPFSAGITVLLVMNASPGAIISKSIWRVAGSVAGATAAIALVAFFVQAPVVFIFGLAAWMGVCTFVGSLLRYNRGYAAVLAGFTVMQIVFGAVTDPERIFDLATSRVAVVTIGVISTALVFLVTERGPARRPLEAQVQALISASARMMQSALKSGNFESAAVERHRIALDLATLDRSVEFAAIEDAGLARFKADLRFAVAELFASLTGGLHVMALVRSMASDSTFETSTAALLDDALDEVARMVPYQSASLARATVMRIAGELRACAAMCRDIGNLAALDQASELLTQIDAALGSLQALQEGAPRAAPVRLRNYLDLRTARRNGIRAALAISIAGLFWIISQWPDGGSMLAMLGPVCGLVSQTDSAAQGSVDFLKGTILAVLGAFVCTYGILPQTVGFPLLMAAMLPFIAASVLVSRIPRFATVAVSFVAYFVTLVAPDNPMHYDLSASINTYLAFLLGGICAVLAFRVLIPPNPVGDSLALARSIRKDVERLAGRRQPSHILVWEHLQHQKLVRLSRRLGRLPRQQKRMLSDCVAAILVGRHLAWLRSAGEDAGLPPSAREAASRTIRSFGRLFQAPERAATAAQSEATQLCALDAPLASLQVAATLRDLALLLSAHADFFSESSSRMESIT